MFRVSRAWRHRHNLALSFQLGILLHVCYTNRMSQKRICRVSMARRQRHNISLSDQGLPCYTGCLRKGSVGLGCQTWGHGRNLYLTHQLDILPYPNKVRNPTQVGLMVEIGYNPVPLVLDETFHRWSWCVLWEKDTKILPCHSHVCVVSHPYSRRVGIPIPK